MRGLWKGPETFRKTAFLYPTPFNLSTASLRAPISPDKTTCSEEFMFAGTATYSSCDISLSTGLIFSMLAPIRATIPPLPFGQDSSMSNPLFLVILSASSKVKYPLARRAVYSPRLCPETR